MPRREAEARGAGDGSDSLLPDLQCRVACDVQDIASTAGRGCHLQGIEWLKDATSSQRRIPQTKPAAALGIHRNTFRNKMRLNKLTRSFAPLSDDDLDTILRAFKVENPNSGLRYALGFLKQNGVHIQKSRVRLSLRRIDGLRQALRNHAAINRREYVVPYPNYLWHIDGRHKLIRWAIVIHGGADGFDRVVSF